MAHDVSRELRNPHGEWTKGGALIHRLTSEAVGRQNPTQEEATRQIAAINHSKRVRVGSAGIVKNSKGYRVELPGVGSKSYSTPEHAGQAVAEGRHHDESAAPNAAIRKVVTPPTEVPKAGSDIKIMRRDNLRKQLDTPEKARDAFIKDLITRAEYEDVLAFHRQATPAPVPKAPAPKPAGKRVAIRDLPAGYYGMDTGQKDYKGQRIVEVHGPEGHIADLMYHDYTTPVTHGGSRIATGSRRTTGYTYKLVHPDARNAAKAIQAGRTYGSTMDLTESRLEYPLGKSAAQAIKQHHELLARAPKPSALPTPNRGKVTAPSVRKGMRVRSPYLGDGKSFYTVDTLRKSQGINTPTLWIGTKENTPRPEYAFGMNTKFEVTDTHKTGDTVHTPGGLGTFNRSEENSDVVNIGGREYYFHPQDVTATTQAPPEPKAAEPPSPKEKVIASSRRIGAPEPNPFPHSDISQADLRKMTDDQLQSMLTIYQIPLPQNATLDYVNRLSHTTWAIGAEMKRRGIKPSPRSANPSGSSWEGTSDYLRAAGAR